MAAARNRGWLWFLLILFGLSLAAMISLIVYNLGQQLTPAELSAAKRLWREKGPRSYQLSYTVKRGIEASTDIYVIRVRDGKVVSSAVNDRPEPKNRFAYRGMDVLFDDIDRFQRLDAQPGRPRTYTRAIFDQTNGGLRWYVRRVIGHGDVGRLQSEERTEIIVDALVSLNEPGP